MLTARENVMESALESRGFQVSPRQLPVLIYMGKPEDVPFTARKQHRAGAVQHVCRSQVRGDQIAMGTI